MQTIARGVFEAIVDQSPFVPEETMEEQKTKVGHGDLSAEEIPENEVSMRRAVSKKKTALGKNHSRKDGLSDERGRDDCGTFEDTGPLLQFDYKAVADRLLEMTSRKNTPPSTGSASPNSSRNSKTSLKEAVYLNSVLRRTFLLMKMTKSSVKESIRRKEINF